MYETDWYWADRCHRVLLNTIMETDRVKTEWGRLGMYHELDRLIAEAVATVTVDRGWSEVVTIRGTVQHDPRWNELPQEMGLTGRPHQRYQQGATIWERIAADRVEVDTMGDAMQRRAIEVVGIGGTSLTLRPVASITGAVGLGVLDGETLRVWVWQEEAVYAR